MRIILVKSLGIPIFFVAESITAKPLSRWWVISTKGGRATDFLFGQAMRNGLSHPGQGDEDVG